MLIPNSIVEGKWSRKKYRVKKHIASGGVAHIYLVEDMETKKDYVLKISQDSLSINREYELLKKFSNNNMIVNTYGIDDYHIDNNIYYFILLEYIEGLNLKEYSRKNRLTKNTIIGIILILIKGIEVFHREEYIIGDLKPENIMIDKKNYHIRLIDLGGVVKKGEGIKEFTPVYDRGSWKCGDRRGEVSYDLFALMMIFTKLLLMEDINPMKEGIYDIIEKLKKPSIEMPLRNYIVKGLLSNQRPLEDFEKELKNLYISNKRHSVKENKRLRDKRVNIFFVSSLVCFIFTLFFVFFI